MPEEKMIHEEGTTIRAYDGMFVGDRLFLTWKGYGAVFAYDVSRSKLFLCRKLRKKSEKIDDVLKHVNVENIELIEYNNKIYLFPLFEKFVQAMDVAGEELRKFTVQSDEKSGKKFSRIGRPVRVEDKVYLFPAFNSRKLMFFDLKAEKLQELSGWWEQLEKEISIDQTDEFSVIYAFDRFWGIKDGASYIFEFDKELRLLHKYSLEGISPYAISADESGLWILLHNSGNAVYWDIASKQSCLYKNEFESIADMQYVQIVSVGGKHYLLPYRRDCIAVIDTDRKSIYDLKMPDGAGRISGDADPLFSKCLLHDQKLYFVPLAANCLLILDLEKQRLEKRELVVDEELLFQLMNLECKSSAMEEPVYCLSDYIKFVQRQDIWRG